MKISQTLFILFLGFLPVFSQDANQWVRIETENKELSLAVPQTNIIDAEKRDFGQRFRVIAFENGVEIEIKITKESGAKERIGRMFDSGTVKSNVLKVGDFLIRKSEPQMLNGKVFFNSFAIAKKDNFYLLIVRSKTGDEPEVARFLYSIRLDGKPLIVQKQENNFPEQITAISDLKTSAEIIEAFKRKTGKNKGKVSYELESLNSDDKETEDLTHRAITLERPLPRFNPPIQNGIISNVTVDIRLKVQFLADGQIGDIVVLSDSDKNFTKAAIDSVRKTVFIPARRGTEYVDSFQTIRFSARMFSSAPIIIRR